VKDARRAGDVVGHIRRRLLVNQWVDPDEVKVHLPGGIRPHLGSNGGVVVGCCMLEIDDARPWPLPRSVGIGIRAAAHRISVEVGPEDKSTLAVWVPVRHTDSRAAVLAGGRVFPGVHATADVAIDADARHLSWSITGASRDFDISASAALDRTDDTASEVADIVIGTALGLSPGLRPARVEAVEMNPGHKRARIVELTGLDSAFMNGFSSATPAETLLMADVDVTWHPVKSPSPSTDFV